MMPSYNIYKKTRADLQKWQEDLNNNLLLSTSNLQHSFLLNFNENSDFLKTLREFSFIVAAQLERLVEENHLPENLPRLDQYDSLGNLVNKVKHHPAYIAAGELIYSTGITNFLVQPGKLSNALALLLLSSHAGEAGHNCPIACSAGIIRILHQFPTVPDRDFYLKKLTGNSFSMNYTGSQFLTEIQGGSDVGLNACRAKKDDKNQWLIYGEKWFCSNANAELFLMTARFDTTAPGTSGLGLFLIPAKIKNNQNNNYLIRRLKDKTGTRSMATAEIDFLGAHAFSIGEIAPGSGIKLVLENVLHLSRIFNAFSVLGMTRRAYQIAFYYAKHRTAFGKQIINFPLVQQQLAKIKSIYTAQIAASFRIAKMQDTLDLKKIPSVKEKLLLRLLVNLNKYFTAKFSVENIRHCLDILAGNGTIHTFSSLPRLLNDAVVCENWEGTHFTLWMQILRDIERYQVDTIFLNYIDEELKKIPKEHDVPPKLRKLQFTLTQLCFNLQSYDTKLKTLAIEDIVLNMAILFSALELFKESLQQISNSKSTCLTLFLNYFTCHKEINSEFLSDLHSILFSK